MANQDWVNTLAPYYDADGTALTAAALGELSPRPPKQINGYLLKKQRSWRFSAMGRITTAATPGTWNFGLYMGTSDTIASGQAIVNTGAVTAVASMTNVTWEIQGELQVRAEGTGTNGSVFAWFRLFNVFAAGQAAMAPVSGAAAVSIDTTVANYIKLGLTPSVATGSCTCHTWNVEQLN
jgi:hypothetical protein